MAECIFCKIVRGAVAAEKIYEDSNFIAFLDVKPLSPGHTLIVPKKHYRWVWDVPNVGAYFEVAQRIAIAERKAFGTEFILSKVIGDEVPHAHIWLFPDTKITGNKMDLKGNAEKLRSALK